MIHTDPKRRHDFVFLFDVVNGNPNGDPDAGNLPRMDPETGHGLVTDVALKRKVRDYICLMHQRQEGYKVFIQSQVALNTLILRAFRGVGVEPPQIGLEDEELIDWFQEANPEGFTIEQGKLTYGGESMRRKDILNALTADLENSEGTKGLRPKLNKVAGDLAKASKGKAIKADERSEARQRLCRDYYDIRMFGAVLSTGLNAGQVRGPMQLTFGRSLDPILPLDLTITRQARTTAERMETGTTEMGRKPIVLYGLYRAHGFYNPFLGEDTGVTEGDLVAFWKALSEMFNLDRSASRGEMACRGLYVFSHGNEKGNAPAHKLFDRILVKTKGGKDVPRHFADYPPVEIDTKELQQGNTTIRIVDATKLKENDDLTHAVVLTRVCEG